MYSVSNDDQSVEATSVLVVGGGLVGLSAAMFLAWRGVPVVLVEKHPGSSPHPRAIGYTPRTMELLRQVGLGDRVPQVAPGMKLRRVRVESLAGAWFEESSWTPDAPAGPVLEYSPCTGAAVAQDRLEPILRDRAIELGADVRLSTRVLGVAQDDEGVTASLQRADGSRYELRASYLVAADGHRSPLRESLGIGRSGRGHMSTARSVIFRAPLEDYLRSGVSQFTVDQPGFSAFVTTYGDGRWLLIFRDDVERDEAALRQAIERAIGRSDLPVEIVTTGRWTIGAHIADRFASGRVFLAGDAAHTLPPTRGGYGANTGIDDAHNLAWKLASVLSGASSPALLDTYDAERRAIAWLRHDQTFARPDFRDFAGEAARRVPILDDAAIEFGQLYRSSAVLGAGPGLPPAARPEQWAGQPGTRAPHLWLSGGDGRRSTLDLLGRGWVLLADGDRWEPAADRASASTGVDLAVVDLGAMPSGDRDALRAALGLAGGASLVRPDGYIAWRAAARPDDAAGELTGALGAVASARSLRTPTRRPSPARPRSRTWRRRPRAARTRRWPAGARRSRPSPA